MVIALLVIDEEEDTSNTAFAKSRAPYQSTIEHKYFTENYKWLFPSPVSRYCFDNSQRRCVRIWFTGQICFAIAANPRLRRSSNYLLFSLAIADLIVTLVCEPFLLEMFYNRAFVYECKPNLERLYSILANLSCSASVVHLACISVDRFIAVVFPLHHEIVMKRCGLKIMLIASWAFPISVPILMVVLPPSFPKGFLAIASFAFSYFVVIFSYLLIMVFLLIHKRKRKRLRARAVSVDPSPHMEIRVACTLTIVIGVFMACWVQK